jgi:hypothetical protein
MATIGQPLDFQALPAAPAGSINVAFQADAPTAPPTAVIRKISAYVTFAYDNVIYFPVLQSRATQEIFRKNVRHAENYPGNFAGSGGSVASANAATASTTFTVYQNGTAVGTIVWAASATTPTFTTTSGAALAFAIGDIMTIVGPATADATLTNWSATLVGTRAS